MIAHRVCQEQGYSGIRKGVGWVRRQKGFPRAVVVKTP